MQLIFVTGNIGKYNEVKQKINPKIELIQKDLNIKEIQSEDLEEVSKDKALKAYNVTNKPVLVDDTGVFFNNYPNFPGVFAKFVFNSLGKGGIKKLFYGIQDNTGSMQTVFSYMDVNLSEPISFIGITKGSFDINNLNSVPESSLPYNYIFVPDGWSNPVIDNYDIWKQNYSQRNKALQKFNDYIEYNINFLN